MKALLRKDLYILLKYSKQIALILAAYALIGAFMSDSGDIASLFSVMGPVFIIIAVMFPISSIAYDEKAGWEAYALTLPVSRAKVVLAKYLLEIIIAAAGFALLLAIALILGALGPNADMLGSMALFFSFSLLLISVMLPCAFKFGADKSRYIILAVILVPWLIVLGLNKAGALGGLSVVGSWPAIGLSLAGGAVITALSAALSVRIYKRKEF